MRTKLFNPFIFLAGGKALALGLAGMVMAALLGFFGRSHFNGVLDFHKFRDVLPLYISFTEQAIIFLCLVVPFYAAGRIFSRSQIRLVDVAGTLALARWPMILTAMTGFGLPADIRGLADITAGVIVLALVGFVFVIWMVALSYNAFSVSCNIKGSKAVSIFIVCLLIAEISAFYCCSQLYPHS